MTAENKTTRAVLLVTALALTLVSTLVEASVTRVGNGDDGGDLEGGSKVTSGILIETRDKALARVKKLNVQSVPSLGSLIPELEKSELFFATRDVSAKLSEDHGGLEGSPDGKLVYARTFAEPHAATRFFPAALMLNEEQLIALHIHEALHRALPPSTREKEEAVTKITLAIAAPDTSIDRVLRVTGGEIPASARETSRAGSDDLSTRPDVVAAMNAAFGAPLERPSTLSYSFRTFMMPDKDKASYPIESMHSLQSFLYPFGNRENALGLGIELSYLKAGEQSFMGPLALSGRMKFTTIRGFDIGGFATLSLNTTSSDELKNSPLGRDIMTFGLSTKREAHAYYVENSIALTGQSQATQKIGNITYTHEYGAVTAVAIKAGAKLSGFELGGFGEAILADFYRVRGGAFQGADSGRYRIIAAGPEIAWSHEALRLAANARWIVDSTPGVDLDTVGDIMGRGVGQGFITTSATLRF